MIRRIIKNPNFPKESFNWLASVEDGHFWFEQRSKLIGWAIRQFSGSPVNFLDVGCGTGFVLAHIGSAFPKTRLFGVDYYAEAISVARQRCPKACITKGDALKLDTGKLFDAVGCFDVLEHIHDDEALLKKIRNLISPRGRLFLSVPQHPGLWSSEDALACHQRRYTSSGLIKLAETCGLKCVWRTSFVCSLAPFMFYRRFRPNSKPGDAGVKTIEFSLPGSINWIFGRLLAVERSLIATGISLPFGGSLLMVLEKK